MESLIELCKNDWQKLTGPTTIANSIRILAERVRALEGALLNGETNIPIQVINDTAQAKNPLSREEIKIILSLMNVCTFKDRITDQKIIKKLEGYVK